MKIDAGGGAQIAFATSTAVSSCVSLPSLRASRVRGNWQAQYVSLADLERTAAEQSSWRFRSDNRRKVIFLRKCRDHFSSACPVLIDEQHDPAVEFPWAYAFSDDKD